VERAGKIAPQIRFGLRELSGIEHRGVHSGGRVRLVLRPQRAELGFVLGDPERSARIDLRSRAERRRDVMPEM